MGHHVSTMVHQQCHLLAGVPTTFGRRSVEDNVIDLKSLVKACARNPGDVSREFQVSNSYCLTICLGLALHTMVGSMFKTNKSLNKKTYVRRRRLLIFASKNDDRFATAF